MVPVMKLWIWQWNVYVPGLSMTKVLVPVENTPVVKEPLSAVSEWFVPSSLVTVIVWPALACAGLGWYWKL